MNAAPDRPLYVGAALGFRIWSFTDGKLAAQFYVVRKPALIEWTMGGAATVAGCSNGCPHSPSGDCTCGLHAYHDLDFARERHRLGMARPGARFTGPKRPLVLGAVLGWGDLEVHHHGWRAGRALPIAFLRISSLREPDWDQLSLNARAPVFDDPDELAAYAAERAQPVPEGVRPDKPPPAALSLHPFS